MAEDEEIVLRRGDTQTDSDGNEWWISSVSFQNGKPLYSRILVGSFAYNTMKEQGIIEPNSDDN